jgi:hypothetical protein
MSLFSNESHAFEVEVERVQSQLVESGTCPESQARWRAEQVVWSRALSVSPGQKCQQG